MGKIKHSNNPFEGTKKAFWNKGITKNKKIFPAQRKEVLNNCNSRNARKST